MKKLLFVIPALLLFALIGAPNAHADSYTPAFSCISEQSSDFQCLFGATGGVTAPDVPFPSPANFSVTVSGEGRSAIFNTSLAVGDSPTDTYQWLYIDGGETTGGFSYAFFELTDDTTNLRDTVTLHGQNLPVTGADEEAGSLTFSPASAAAPEPSPILLMLLGVGVIFLMCRRFILRLA